MSHTNAIIISKIIAVKISVLSSIDISANASVEPICIPARESKAPVVASDGNVYTA